MRVERILDFKFTIIIDIKRPLNNNMLKKIIIIFNEKFLSLWKDADPGIAEAEDVKKRVAGLKEKI